jgi:hypothetical protein
MKKGDIVTIEGEKEPIKLLHPIGKKDEGGQFWEVEFKNGNRDVKLLRER